MAFPKHIHVECTNSGCPSRPRAVVHMEEVGPGVLRIPRDLVCGTCGFHMYNVLCGRSCREE